MSRNENRSPGEEMAEQFFAAIREAESAPAPDARELYVIRGITSGGKFGRPVENVLSEVGHHMAETGRVFIHGNSVVMEVARRDGSGLRLVTLAGEFSVEHGANYSMSNLFVCADGNGAQFPVPTWFAGLMMGWEPLADLLPRIRHYGTRAVFDSDFVLRGPGWHPEAGVLVHGPALVPIVGVPLDADLPPLERLPPRLRELLREFCFDEGADVANTVGLFLSGLLANLLAESGKALALIDANKPGLGKTLLARVIGVVLDGEEPSIIHHSSDDEELAKRICATLRGGCRSVLLFDNARTKAGGRVASAALEANSVAPVVSLRILSRSENFTRPNTFLWVLTMNGTRVSPDLVSRSLPIRLHLEGRPEERSLSGDPVTYAREHRLEILGELAGMVVRWNQQGRPSGCRGHRLVRWAEVIGGILRTVGFPEFLANYETASVAFDTDRDDLAALLEAVLRSDGSTTAGPSEGDGGTPSGRTRGRTSSDLVSFFLEAKVMAEELESTNSAQGRALKAAHFLSSKSGQEVPVEVNDRRGRARVNSESGRGRRTFYFVEVTWEPAGEDDAGADRLYVDAALAIEPPTDAAPGTEDSDLAAVRSSRSDANDLEW